MLVKNRKVPPSLQRCPGKLIAFFHLLLIKTHTHTVTHTCTCTPFFFWGDTFCFVQLQSVFPEKFTESKRHSSWRMDSARLKSVHTHRHTNKSSHMLSHRCTCILTGRITGWLGNEKITDTEILLHTSSSSHLTPRPRAVLSKVLPDVHFGWLRCDLTHRMWHQWRMMKKNGSSVKEPSLDFCSSHPPARHGVVHIKHRFPSS